LRSIIIILSLLFCISYLYASNVPVIDVQIDQKKLANGDLQTFVETLETKGDGGKKRVIGILLINATQKEVWNIIKNWDAYGEFVPGLKYYKTLYKKTIPDKPGSFQSYIEGYIKIPVPFIRKTYTLDVNFDRHNYLINWQLVGNNQIEELKKQGLTPSRSSRVLQNIEGFSYLKPFENGKKTVIYYAPVVEISIPVPQRVERFLSGTIMKGFMEAIKNRAETAQIKKILPDDE